VAFAPDGKTLATGGVDNHVRFWEVGTGKFQGALPAHNAPAGVSRLAYSPDGKLLATASWAGDGKPWAGAVKLWDVASAKQRKVVGTNHGGISFLAFAPDGRFLVWGNAGTIHLYDVAADREARVLSVEHAVDSVAFSPDNRLLASASGGGIVRLWDVTSGKAVRDIRAGQTVATGSQAVAFSRDGKVLATASAQVKLWNVETGAEIAALGPADTNPFCVAFSPDGRFLAAGTMAAVHLWDAATYKEIWSWNEPAYSLAFSRDGRWLAFGCRGAGKVGLVEVGMLAK
jgi:WD40 repeat protein